MNKPVRTRIRIWVRRLFVSLFSLLIMLTVGVIAFLYWQGSKPVDTSGQYVALGSSFAAGIGLGSKADGSPVQCFRTSGGYPALVAKGTGMRLVDMSCSGSTTDHILHGGQLLLGPQLTAIGAKTELVTITTGGNDVGYIGDLMAASNTMGLIGSWLHGQIKPAAKRDFAKVTRNLETIARTIHQRAPGARIVIVSYPTLLPPTGNCPALSISERQADISREVDRLLARASQRAATKASADFIDMAQVANGHDICSGKPWINGASPKTGTGFHPNAAGAAATANVILDALRSRPAQDGEKG